MAKTLTVKWITEAPDKLYPELIITHVGGVLGSAEWRQDSRLVMKCIELGIFNYTYQKNGHAFRLDIERGFHGSRHLVLVPEARVATEMAAANSQRCSIQ